MPSMAADCTFKDSDHDSFVDLGTARSSHEARLGNFSAGRVQLVITAVELVCNCLQMPLQL